MAAPADRVHNGSVRRRISYALGAGAILLVTVGAQLMGPITPANADAPGLQTPLANPPMVESCGADVTLVLDASGSISSSHAVDNVRDAGDAFLDVISPDPGAVLQFADLSNCRLSRGDDGVDESAVFRNALTTTTTRSRRASRNHHLSVHGRQSSVVEQLQGIEQ
jgi:hypothetical protein